MNIKEYKLLSEIGLNEINKLVNEHISQGWAPLGGIGVNCWTEPFNEKTTATKTQYSQAMVKY